MKNCRHAQWLVNLKGVYPWLNNQPWRTNTGIKNNLTNVFEFE